MKRKSIEKVLFALYSICRRHDNGTCKNCPLYVFCPYFYHENGFSNVKKASKYLKECIEEGETNDN